MFMNEYEIETVQRKIDAGYYDGLPNFQRAVGILDRLHDWANNNSDGWASWPKPSRAANSLMGWIFRTENSMRFRSDQVQDISDADLKKAITSIKSFLTRQRVTPEIKKEIVG